MSVNISYVNRSVVRALAKYARGPGFESRLMRDFSAPVTFGFHRGAYVNNNKN